MTTPRKGIKVTVGGREFVVPSLTYGEHKRFRESGLFDSRPLEFSRLGDDDYEVARAALLHNYPDLGDALEELTPAELAELARAAVCATLGMTEIPKPKEGDGPGVKSPEASGTGSSS